MRLANPFGEGQRAESGQGAVAVFLGRILRGETLEVWGDGSVIRDYIYIEDVVTALLLSIDLKGSEHACSTSDRVADTVSMRCSMCSSARWASPAIRRYRPGRSFDVPASVLCIESARRSLGWSPKVDFEGVERFAAWMKRELAAQSLLAIGGYSG